MKRLNEQELREEYIRSLKSERFEIGLYVLSFFGAAIYLIIRYAPGWWKFSFIIPLILIVLAIKKIKDCGMMIQINEGGKTEK